jgi:hypothetical protein
MSQHLMHSLDRPSGTVSRFGTESPIPTWDVLVQERLCGTVRNPGLQRSRRMPRRMNITLAGRSPSRRM